MRHPLWIVALLSLSCGRSSETRQPAAAGSDGQPAPHASPAPSAAVPPDAGAALAAAPAVDTGACTADTDCAFDDPCDPERCVAGASVPAPVGCEKSRPPTGTCVCFEKRCSLRPGPTHPKVSVDADCTHAVGCGLDRAAGRCAPGRDDDLRPQPLVGPRCDCDSHVPQRCHFSWLDPITCTSVDDCWVERLPFAHPIKRPRSKKGKRFRPCKDGERAPACQDGRCTLLAYGC